MNLLAKKFELHYYFNDSSHSMNALIRNHCEAEFLAIAIEISNELNLTIQLESEAYREGGLKEVWEVLGKNSAQVSLIISLIALVSSRIPLIDSEFVDLQKQDLRLSVEERKLRIKKLQTELEDEEVNDKTVTKVAEALEANLKIVTRKSNFYKKLNLYNKIEKIGFSALDSNNIPINDEHIVLRNNFKKFIIHSHNLTPEVIDDALIEIIAPVLKEGRYKWKGIYDNESISFSMNDKDFNFDVLNEVISFKHGSTIECVLLIHKKLDETGEIQITGYSVSTVIRKIDSGEELETLQGKKYKFNKNQVDSQADLFTDL